MIKKQLNDWQERFFDTFIFISYILIVLSIFKLSKSAPKFLELLDYYVRVYICLFLIWRFNPLRSNVEFTELDRKIAFNAGLFIITTTFIKNYLDSAKNKLLSLINNNINNNININNDDNVNSNSFNS